MNIRDTKELQKTIKKYNKLKKDINNLLKDFDEDIPKKNKTAKKEYPWEYCILEEDDNIGCHSYTTKFTRCKAKVKYIIKYMKKYKEQQNIHLCSRHFNVLIDSHDKMTLPNGYIFEGECYV